MAGRAPAQQRMPERELAARLTWKNVALLGEPAVPWLPGERMFDLLNHGVNVYVKYIVQVLKISA